LFSVRKLFFGDLVFDHLRFRFQREGGEGAAEPVPDVDVRGAGLHALQRPRHGLEHSRSPQGETYEYLDLFCPTYQ